MTFHDLSPTKFICRFSRFASSLSKAMMALARAVNLLATKNASKDILNVLTKVHFVQFATFQQSEHKCQILGREVSSCLKPIASSHSDMSKNISISLSPYPKVVITCMKASCDGSWCFSCKG